MIIPDVHCTEMRVETQVAAYRVCMKEGISGTSHHLQICVISSYKLGKVNYR
jgi:hypothetical protein